MNTVLSSLPDDASVPPLTPRECTLTLLRVVLYIIFIVGYCQGILWDASRDVSAQVKFSELSFTEFTQSLILAVSVALLLVMRRRFNVFPVGSLLMAMFLLVSLIRENDYWLDMIFRGLWQIPAIIVAVSTLVYVIRNRAALFVEMRLFFTSRPFGMFLAGFLSVYVFSRLLGRGEVWMAALGDSYQRIIKNMVEECSESIGYMLMLFAIIEIIVLARQLRRRYP